MATTITSERILATAGEFDRDTFTRADLADELGVSQKELKGAIKAARQSGRLEKVGENDDGRGVFRLTGD
jgi:DNA-binding MarR family transcriptional regulator